MDLGKLKYLMIEKKKTNILKVYIHILFTNISKQPAVEKSQGYKVLLTVNR